MYTIHFDTTNTRTPGKLADVELRFTGDAGPLAGLRLIGFALWQRRDGSGFNLTVPARQYTVNGERRSYGLVRPQAGTDAKIDDLREQVTRAWRDGGPGQTSTAYPEPMRPAYVPTTYDTPAPAPPAPIGYQYPPITPAPACQRYDNPDDAARAAQAGTPINILDLIRQADHTNASETREHHRPTVRPAMPQPKPGYTPAGDLIGF
jgi:hypothetical protein